MKQFARLKKYNYLILMVILSSVGHSQTIENFDDINTLQADGWVLDNRSDFPTKVNWFQGIENIFPAQSGAPTSYIANTTATGNNIICNWLIMPDVGNIEQLSFYTRSEDRADELTRMLVMYSPTGSINTGACEAPVNKANKGTNDFGDFQQLLAINPNQDLDGYPKAWTQYTVDVNGSGRVAFLYYVTGTGIAPFNSGLLALDNIAASSASSAAQVVPSLNQIGLVTLFLILILAVYLNTAKLRINK
jgi:hypothetical protein